MDRTSTFGELDDFLLRLFGECDRFRSAYLFLGGVERFLGWANGDARRLFLSLACDFVEVGLGCEGERFLRSVFDGPLDRFVASVCFFGVVERDRL